MDEWIAVGARSFPGIYFLKWFPVRLLFSQEKDIHYGYGIHVLTRHGKEVVGHGGSHWGYRSHLEWYPKENMLGGDA